MNLVDLILLACMLANPAANPATNPGADPAPDPASCHEYHVLFQTSGSLQSCMMQAQPYLAQWSGEHPAFRIVRWRCAWPDQEGGKI
jgi:hypothetical protein